MAINLQKGGNVNLSKTDPNLKQILLGLGWEARSTDGVDFDLDASLFMVTENGRVRSDSDFIFYGQLRSSCGSVEHTGDNRTGAGEGDDEALKIKLEQIPAAILGARFPRYRNLKTIGQLTMNPAEPYLVPLGPVINPPWTMPRIWNSSIKRER